MNIFHLSYCPIESARAQCNRHVVKMVTESANMLLWKFQDLLPLPLTKTGNTPKLSHENHPSTIWTNSSRQNYEWLLTHALELSNEYSRRYKQKHYSESYLDFIVNNYDKLYFWTEDLTPFARCFGSYAETLGNEQDTVEAYQKFYWLDKREFARWPSLSEIPEFWEQKSLDFVDVAFNNGVYRKR